MELQTRDAIGFSLGLLHKIAFYAVLLIFIEVATFIQFFYIEGDLTQFISNAEGFASYGQVFGKLLMVAYQRRSLAALANSTKAFWSTNNCSEDVKNKLDYISSMSKRLQKVFLYQTMVLIAMTNSVAILLKGLPFGIWSMEGYDVYYYIVLYVQVIFLIPLIFFMAGFNNSYLAFSTEIIIQFRILRFCLKELSLAKNISASAKKEYYKKLQLCIEHHDYLLRFTKAFQDVFSFGILAEYFSDTPLVCVEMYGILLETDVKIALKQSLIILFVFIQLAFTCLSAHYISTEALAVADAIYESDWYSENNSFAQVPILLLIQRAQQQITFRAGSLIEINALTLITVMKVSWSTCTVMLRLRQK